MRPSPRMQPFRTTSILVALAALLLCADPTPANDDEAIFAAARSAVVKRRTEQSKVLGFHDTRRTFTEMPEEGAVLIGFDVGVGKFFDIDSVYALRPVYRAVFGEVVGSDYGLFRDRIRPNNKGTVKSKVVRTVHLRARSGYAVGGMTLRSGLNINGLSLTYMKIDGRTLDPKQSYQSDWVGDRTGGGEASVDGKGAPVIGVFGSQSEEHVHALALLFIRDGAPAAPVVPAVPPPATPPKEEKPPILPLELPKIERPVDPPQEEPDDEPPAKEPEPPIPPRKADAPAKGTNWLPYVIFGAVTVPVFLLLAFSFTRRTQVRDQRPTKPKRSAGRSPAPAPPPGSTGIRERPGPGAKRPSRPDDSGIFDELSALLDSSKQAEQEREEVPVERQGLEISLHEFQMPRRRPWWVRLGLWKIHDRTTAGAFFWMSLLMAGVGSAGAVWDLRLLLCLAFVPAALWYWLCIRWVDKHDRWV